MPAKVRQHRNDGDGHTLGHRQRTRKEEERHHDCSLKDRVWASGSWLSLSCLAAK